MALPYDPFDEMATIAVNRIVSPAHQDRTSLGSGAPASPALASDTTTHNDAGEDISEAIFDLDVFDNPLTVWG